MWLSDGGYRLDVLYSIVLPVYSQAQKSSWLDWMESCPRSLVTVRSFTSSSMLDVIKSPFKQTYRYQLTRRTSHQVGCHHIHPSLKLINDVVLVLSLDSRLFHCCFATNRQRNYFIVWRIFCNDLDTSKIVRRISRVDTWHTSCQRCWFQSRAHPSRSDR